MHSACHGDPRLINVLMGAAVCSICLQTTPLEAEAFVEPCYHRFCHAVQHSSFYEKAAGTYLSNACQSGTMRCTASQPGTTCMTEGVLLFHNGEVSCG